MGHTTTEDGAGTRAADEICHPFKEMSQIEVHDDGSIEYTGLSEEAKSILPFIGAVTDIDVRPFHTCLPKSRIVCHARRLHVYVMLATLGTCTGRGRLRWLHRADYHGDV